MDKQNTDIKFELKETTCVAVDLSKQSMYESPDRRGRVDLRDLADCWKNKWKSFSGEWTEERQLYRFLLTTFKLFYYSFMQLNGNKITSEKSENDGKSDYYIHCVGGNLCGVYNFGKKCIDLIKKLEESNKLNKNEKHFMDQFSKTRNKIIEHNFNPSDCTYQIDPVFWKDMQTNSYLNIKFHGSGENEYECKIDYYQDYFRLEKILTKIIKSWK